MIWEKDKSRTVVGHLNDKLFSIIIHFVCPLKHLE